MHHPPLSCERTGGDHFWGERNSWRVATAPFHPFEAPTTPQPVPPSTLRWQWDDFEESTFKLHSPTFSQRRRSSARIAPQVYVGEARIWWPIFQVGVWPRGQNKISDPKTVYLLQLLSARRTEQSVTVPTHLGKAAHPSYLS